MSEHNIQRHISKETVEAFLKANAQLTCFLEEVGKLSNKKPDGPINKFKLGFINQVLVSLNAILGDEFRPFPDFTVFDVEASMPTASDVVIMLSQYERAVAKFRTAHMVTVKSPETDFLTLGRTTTAWNTGNIKPEQLVDSQEE